MEIVEVVIKIPKGYKELVDNVFGNNGLLPSAVSEELLGAISLGTVLPKGHWLDQADKIDVQFERHAYKCSECGRIANYYVGGYESWWDIRKPNYCPNCGAKMTESEDKE